MNRTRLARSTTTTAGLAFFSAILVPGALASATCPDSCPDINNDCVVDGSDLAVVLGAWSASGGAGDLNCDGIVDGEDLAIVLGSWLGNGCIRPMQLASQSLSAYPWAEYVQWFNVGSSVSISVDTLRIPSMAGTSANVYVTQKNPAWAPGAALVDARGGPQLVNFVAGGLPANNFVLTGSSTLSAVDGEKIGRGYDIVIDRNNNGVLDGCDLIDGMGATPGFTVIRDLTQNGPYTPITFGNYAIADTTAGFSFQRLYYPSGIASMTPRPIVVISHGNGHQYTWYDYLGTHLASWGFVVISHQNNTGPTSPVPITPPAYTTIQHTAGLINQQAAIAGGVLNGHLDADTIIWIGHSRGGDGIARAYDILLDGTPLPPVPAVIPYTTSDIKLLIPIAPTDFLGQGGVGSGSDPHDAPLMLVYGSADGDVCGCPGNNIAHSFNIYERGEGEKWSVYVHGADHNDFNCCGFNDFTGPAGTAIGNAAAQAIMKVHTIAAIKSVLENDPAAKELRWRRYESQRPLGVHPTTPVRTDEVRFGAGTRLNIDDFQNSVLATSTGFGPVAFGGSVANMVETLSDDINATFTWPAAGDNFNGQTRNGTGDINRGLVFDWNGAGTIQWGPPAGGSADFSKNPYLGFRAAQGTRHPLGTATPSTFTVTLTDTAGVSSTLSVGAYDQGQGQTYQRTGFGVGAGWQNELQLVRLRLDDFRRHGNAIDLSQIAFIRFNFGAAGESASGRLVIDDLSLLAE